MKLSLKNTLKKFQKNDYDSILNLINNTLTFNHNWLLFILIYDDILIFLFIYKFYMYSIYYNSDDKQVSYCISS
jgi:hypothetical protein